MTGGILRRILRRDAVGVSRQGHGSKEIIVLCGFGALCVLLLFDCLLAVW